MDTATLCQALLDKLHDAPLLSQSYRVLWTPNGGACGTKKLSHWVAGRAPLRAPDDWKLKNTYFGVNPSAIRRADYLSSTNDTIGATRAFLAEFDGKDFVQEHEWLPFYVEPDLAQVAADARVELQDLELSDTRMEQRIAGRQRGALQRAQTAAIDAAYKVNPDEYKGRALAHINSLPQQPTALWNSGGGYQGVWIFNEPVYLYNPDGTRNLDAFERMTKLQHKWTAYVGGDRAASDIRRILRLPDSINFKPKYAPNYPVVEFVYCDLDRTFDLDELVALLPAETPKRERRQVFVPKGAPVELGNMGDVPVLPRHFAIDELNRQTNLRELLIGYGYTPASGNRLSRPGGDTAGVELHKDNTATIYSSADPLYCERRIHPADAIVMYDHGGNVEAFLTTIPDAKTFQESLRLLRTFTESVSFAPLIPPDLVCEHGYRTDSTDTKVASALIDKAMVAGSLTFESGLGSLKTLSGVRSRSTVTNTLNRLAGWFVTITPGNVANKSIYTLNLDVVRTLDRSLFGNADLSKVRTTYSQHKVDDPWQSGCTRRLRKAAKAATEGVQRTSDKAKSPAACWLDEHVAKGLGETMLRVVAALENIGDATRKEIAAATGKLPSSIATATRRAEEIGLLDAERDHSRAPAIYSLADNYMALVAEIAPTLRTHGLSHECGEKDATEEQSYLERTLEAAKEGKIALSSDRTKKLVDQLARAKNRRAKHLKWLHPEWSSVEINRWIDAPSVHAHPVASAERLDRLRHVQRVGERAEYRPKHHTETEADKWRRKEYAKDIAAAGYEWAELNAWALLQHGDGWWMRRDKTDIIGQYRLFKVATEQAPTMHWAGENMANVIFEFDQAVVA